MSNSLPPARLLCPWDSPGKNTGVGCQALLRGFPDPGNKARCPVSPALQAGSFPLVPPGELLHVSWVTFISCWAEWWVLSSNCALRTLGSPHCLPLRGKFLWSPGSQGAVYNTNVLGAFPKALDLSPVMQPQTEALGAPQCPWLNLQILGWENHFLNPGARVIP